jgi:glycosyltransferase involved in cell wall biosynthesis
MAHRLPRILVIGALPPPQHGVTGVNEILLRAVRQSKAFDVRHLDISDRRPISTVERFDWGNVYAALKHGMQCLWQLLAWRPDIVYVPLSQKALGFLRDSLFLVPARLVGCGVVVHLHGGNFHEFYRGASPLLQALIRFCLVRVHAAIVLGESLKSCFVGLVPHERIVVVPNGIPDFATTGIPARPNARLRALYWGTVDTEKGIHVFLDAALRILGQTDGIEFLVAGPWFRASERDEILNLVRTQNRENAIRFLGEVSGAKKNETLFSADILVFPSVDQEGLPLVVLEAMCAGLPVIAADRGCLREVVVEGHTGYVIPPGNTAALVDKVLVLARDPALCARLGQAARQRYLAEYCAERFGKRIIEVFEGLAAAPAKE